jgi:diguanylate cyclase (GGDEF)-like protein
MPNQGPKAFGQWMNQLSQRQALLLAYGILLPLTALDYATPPDVSYSIFYMIPVVIVGWRASFRHAAAMSFIASVLLAAANVHSGVKHSSLWVYCWNPGTRFAIYFGICFLLQKLRTTVQELSILSEIDSLTGVRNRRAFVELLDNELSRHRRTGQSIAVAFIDLDRFKEINDTHGHQKGDQVLQTVAGILLNHLRKSDVVGRFGGDEFAILMPETTADGAQSALEAVLPRMCEAQSTLGFPVTFSVGVVSGRGKMTSDQLIHEADMVMYEVKKEGGNSIRQRECKVV